MDHFRKDFRNTVDYFSGRDAAIRSVSYADGIQAEIDKCVSTMQRLVENNKDIKWAKGDVAEAWHAGTYNIDATRKHLETRAEAPRDHSPTDIVVRNGLGDEHRYQVKYHQDPLVNLEALSDKKYDGLGKIAPEGHTIADGIDDRVGAYGAESKPLQGRDASELVRQIRSNDMDHRQFGLTLAQNLHWQDIFREATTAGARAAIMGAALQMVPAVVAIARKAWETGEITTKDFAPIVRSIPTTLLRSGVAGGLSAAIVGAVRKGVVGAGQQVDPTLVAAGVVLAIGAVGTLRWSRLLGQFKG